METFKIKFFSLKQVGGSIELQYPYDDHTIVIEFINIFSNNIDHLNKTVSLNYKYKNSTDLQNRLEEFVVKYKEKIPAIQRFRKSFASLLPDEWFFVFPCIQLSTRQRYEMETELQNLNNKKNMISEELIQDIFGDIIDNYEQKSFDLHKDGKIKIGENKKKDRICRFCNFQIPKTTFKKEAHAISEALGNKKLILNEECDACNEFFDKNIERDFIGYHDFVRTLYGIKNKSNIIPKFKGSNFEFSQNSDHSLAILIQEENLNTNQENLILDTGRKIKRQNIYKSLCKYALSVIDSSYLSNFQNTILWLKDEIKINKLPKIVVYTSNNSIYKIPEITLFIRNNNDYNLPYLVGEFKIACYIYIFIVPFSKEDKKTFLEEKEYICFLNCFRHINIDKGFSYLNFSSNEKVDLNIKMTPKNNL